MTTGMKVAILMGSPNDRVEMQPAADMCIGVADPDVSKAAQAERERRAAIR